MSSKKYLKYTKYLESDEWKEKRKLVAKDRNNTCELCGKSVLFGFHIHHLTYERIFNEDLDDLMFLCAECHSKVHGKPLFEKQKTKKVANNEKPKTARKTTYERIKSAKSLRAKVNTAINSKKEIRKIFEKHFGAFLNEIKDKK